MVRVGPVIGQLRQGSRVISKPCPHRLKLARESQQLGPLWKFRVRFISRHLQTTNLPSPNGHPGDVHPWRLHAAGYNVPCLCTEASILIGLHSKPFPSVVQGLKEGQRASCLLLQARLHCIGGPAIDEDASP